MVSPVRGKYKVQGIKRGLRGLGWGRGARRVAQTVCVA